MYKSPVDVFEEISTKISTKITEETDNHIVAEIEKAIGVAVDKDELIKALNYDRNQYNQGYNDAKELYAPKRVEWIPVSERLPEDDTEVIVSCTDDSGDSKYSYTTVGWHYKCMWVINNDRSFFVKAWMPLPEPYKAKSEGKK